MCSLGLFHTTAQVAKARHALAEQIGEVIELPQIHPAKVGQGQARWVWGAGLDAADREHFFDRTVRIDLQTGERREWPRPDAVQMEPLFVARPDSVEEDDGVLLVPTLSNTDRATMIAVLDPRRMECIATIEAPQVIPFGFHAAFKPV